MKKLVLVFAALIALLTAPAIQAGDQDFVLVNDTGVTIEKLYVSPHSSEEWGEDILGAETLDDGESATITFHPDEEAKMWDLRVEDGSGNFIVWENLNLLKVSKVTLHLEKGQATATTE